MTSDAPGQCFVSITFPSETEPVTAGRFALSVDRRGVPEGRFVYGRSYLKRPNAVALDPGRSESALSGSPSAQGLEEKPCGRLQPDRAIHQKLSLPHLTRVQDNDDRMLIQETSMTDPRQETASDVMTALIRMMERDHLPAVDFAFLKEMFQRGADGQPSVWYVGQGIATGPMRAPDAAKLAATDLCARADQDMSGPPRPPQPVDDDDTPL